MKANRKSRIISESQLVRIVTESVNACLNEGIPTVSYNSDWNDEGTHFNQTIKIGLTKEELATLSSKISEMADEYESSDDTSRRDASRYLHRSSLKFGRNFLKLSELKAISDIMNWSEYKRVHLDRNTCLLIVEI